MLRTLAADAGTRLTGVLYLVATAAFLGVGVAPDAADWAVMADRNRTGLLVQPWAVVPALTMGTLRRRAGGRPPKRPGSGQEAPERTPVHPQPGRK
jgi:hypothetical protein